ncbi:LuxR C-terminal-related transcriptional regulator [Bifidobacterium olomucense]|uniref:Two component transcriptional regulator, LuxR family n=1 Tax=Bifidobacterium olomucense TaxID=2675324 RepID=A0A7Y0EXY6_9BIFI|nr:LuxR C-terminal-related transcriptional regulator [Bifidobacterium sp. DSM 109959]NMM98470.1 two component transcriptional regulator, LuxR family [Bifidobacterium sp. DSM 109959]
MSVEQGKDTTSPVLVAAVDNDRMALLALQGILPQLMSTARWMWGVGTADEAVRMALDPQTRPRVLMVDMSLGDATGVSVCRTIRSRTDRVLLLGITAFTVETYAERIAAAGAQGIASKADIPQLAQALRTVAAGGTFVPPSMRAAASAPLQFHTASDAHRMLVDGTTANHGNGMDNDGRPAPKLGAKEAETLHLLSRGLTYDQIAAQWGVTASTVRTHAHRAVDKLGAHSLAHAIALWLSR